MIRLEIEALNHQGLGIGKYNGKVIFVENALVKEIVLVQIIKETKKYSLARVVDYIKKSDKRCDFPCIYYDRCGGCNIGMMTYKEQLSFKRNKVIDIFKRYGGLDIDPVINAGDCFHYRNKVIVHVEHGKVGFYEKDTNKLVAIDECLIADERINEGLNRIKLLDLNLVEKIMIRVTYKDIMVVVFGKINELDLIRKLNYVTSIYVNDKLIYGKDKIIEKLGSYLFYISKESFFQVNSKQAYNLYMKVLQYASLNNQKHVLDLYCGTGTIGIFLSKYCLDVVGIEINSNAIIDANLNKKLNKVDNITFIAADSSYVAKLDRQFDVVVVDPPRSGLDVLTINNLNERRVERLVYVSCNPMTLVRDLKLLGNVYELEQVELFDMFVNDYHVECICCLSLKE